MHVIIRAVSNEYVNHALLFAAALCNINANTISIWPHLTPISTSCQQQRRNALRTIATKKTVTPPWAPCAQSPYVYPKHNLCIYVASNISKVVYLYGLWVWCLVVFMVQGYRMTKLGKYSCCCAMHICLLAFKIRHWIHHIFRLEVGTTPQPECIASILQPKTMATIQ